MFYNRVCTLNLNGRVFKYDLSSGDRFQIEFVSDFDVSKISNNSTIKLYNPNDETIESCRPTVIGRNKQYKLVTLEAGYKSDNGIVLAGEIFDLKVTKNGVNRVLELSCAGNISKFGNFPINKTYRMQTTSQIVRDLILQAGFSTGGIKPETEIYYPTLTITDFRAGMKRLANDAFSDFYITKNLIYFKRKNATNESISIDFATGLLQEPEKIDNGYTVKSLFNYRILQGNKIIIKGKKSYTLKVNRGKHEFNVSGNAVTNFDGAEL